MEDCKKNTIIKHKFFDYQISQNNFKNVDFKNLGIISTINAYSFYYAEHNHDFKIALKDSNILLPDGISICYGMKFLYSKRIKKISGFDLLENILINANNQLASVFFLGSNGETLTQISNNINCLFPKIKLTTYNPGYFDNIADFQIDKIINKINNKKPDILLVGLSAPKQELFVHNIKDKIEVGTICSIGAAFDFFAGTKKRPSEFFVKLGLEGLIRTIHEPKTQIIKDIKSYPYFIYRLIKEKLKLCNKKQP